MRILGLGLNHGKYLFIYFLARLIDHEEPWKNTDGSGWC